MKTISTALRNNMASESTTLCTCWVITRTDGTVLRFTDLDMPLVVGGQEFQPAVGYNRTATQTSGDMSVDNLDVEGIIDDETITLQDLRAGKYNYAEVRVFLVDWTDPEAGSMAIRRGWLGEITTTPQGKFITELRGLNQALSQKVGETFSPECRADLGDNRCKIAIDSDAWARNGTVLAVVNRRRFTVSFTTADPRMADASWYAGGVLSWLTGDNNGVNIEVKSWSWNAGTSVGTLELFLSMPFNIQVGDTFRVRPGCDKRRTTCINKFDNILNMRAEPFIPGQDLLQTYPDSH